MLQIESPSDRKVSLPHRMHKTFIVGIFSVLNSVESFAVQIQTEMKIMKLFCNIFLCRLEVVSIVFTISSCAVYTVHKDGRCCLMLTTIWVRFVSGLYEHTPLHTDTHMHSKLFKLVHRRRDTDKLLCVFSMFKHDAYVLYSIYKVIYWERARLCITRACVCSQSIWVDAVRLFECRNMENKRSARCCLFTFRFVISNVRYFRRYILNARCCYVCLSGCLLTFCVLHIHIPFLHLCCCLFVFLYPWMPSSSSSPSFLAHSLLHAICLSRLRIAHCYFYLNYLKIYPNTNALALPRPSIASAPVYVYCSISQHPNRTRTNRTTLSLCACACVCITVRILLLLLSVVVVWCVFAVVVLFSHSFSIYFGAVLCAPCRHRGNAVTCAAAVARLMHLCCVATNMHRSVV